MMPVQPHPTSTASQLGLNASLKARFIIHANAKQIWCHNSTFAAIFASELDRVKLLQIICCEFVLSTFAVHSQKVWTGLDSFYNESGCFDSVKTLTTVQVNTIASGPVLSQLDNRPQVVLIIKLGWNRPTFNLKKGSRGKRAVSKCPFFVCLLIQPGRWVWIVGSTQDS